MTRTQEAIAQGHARREQDERESRERQAKKAAEITAAAEIERARVRSGYYRIFERITEEVRRYQYARSFYLRGSLFQGTWDRDESEIIAEAIKMEHPELRTRAYFLSPLEHGVEITFW